ncbi:MAG: putative sporulation protein YtxC [Clostridia bacterium]|nr:putative sporulation protein YtxC [Clostridia bacterium]MBQ6893945.1 putative sporulation protein YtxC [Clostridia bacterium]
MIEHKIDDIRIYNTSKIFDNIKKEEIGDIVAEWVVDNLEKDLVTEIFEKNYEGFSNTDKKIILVRTNDRLSASRRQRFYAVKTATDEYLKENKNLNVIGFTRFRLQNYKEYLKNTIDDTIEKYLVEKEYKEFINLIKEYLVYQDSFINILNVFTERNKYVYMDEKGEDITARLEDTFIVDDNLSESDKLLTILILCNPKKINWHNPNKGENKDLIKTVISIFGGRVKFHKNCEPFAVFDSNRLDNL